MMTEEKTYHPVSSTFASDAPEINTTATEQAVAKEYRENLERVEKAKVEAPRAITVSADSQMMVARDNTELVRMIRIFMKGLALPKTLDTEEKIITAWQAAASLKVPPIIAMSNIAIIHGSLAIWGQLPKALAEATGQLEDFQLLYIDKDHKVISLENANLASEVWGAVVRIQRKGRTMNEYFFTEPEAKTAGLLSKSGPWKDYRKVMYARRAMGQGIKFEFPDALMGLSIAEYDYHEAPDLRDITPPGPDAAKLINDTLKEKKDGK